MAETRAKARALRDAINVGVSAVEELDDTDDGLPMQVPAVPPGSPTPIRRPPATTKPATGTATAPPKGPTPSPPTPTSNAAAPPAATPAPQATTPVGVVSEALVAQFARGVEKAKKLAVVPPRTMGATDAEVTEQIALLAKAINARIKEIAGDPPALSKATGKLAEALATPGAAPAAKSVADLYEPATPPATAPRMASEGQLAAIADYAKRKGLTSAVIDDEVFFFSGKATAALMTAAEAAQFIAGIPRPTPATTGR
jgi:hypothetical protein